MSPRGMGCCVVIYVAIQDSPLDRVAAFANVVAHTVENWLQKWILKNFAGMSSHLCVDNLSELLFI